MEEQEFSNIFLPKNTILTITHRQGYLWRNLENQWRSSSIPLEQKQSKVGYTEEDQRNTFAYPVLLPHKVSQKIISLSEESDREGAHGFPSCVEHRQTGPHPPHPSRILKCASGQMPFSEHQRHTASTRKGVRKPLETPYSRIPQLIYKHPQCSTHLTHTHSGWFPVHTSKSSKSKPLQIATEHLQKASPNLWDWEKVHKLEHSTPSYGKDTEGCQHSVQLCRIERRQASKNFPPRKNKKYETDLSIESLRNLQNRQEG